jgi:hypothetical protein
LSSGGQTCEAEIISRPTANIRSFRNLIADIT